MGQYHYAINMDVKEHISSHNLDCGLKMWEILYSCHRVTDAMVILLANNEAPSDQPADLYMPGTTGRWAGQAAMYVGDYAEDGDMANWRWSTPESEVYGAAGSDGDDDGGIPEEWVEISSFVKPVIERSSGMMYAGRGIGGSGDLTEVKPKEGGGYTIDIPKDANEYLRDRLMSCKEEIEARTDVSFLAPEDFAKGQRRLMVNLDKREFVDPEAFGEVPTLAGILKGMIDVYDAEGWSSNQALNSMLFFNGARGGGDAEGEMIGRWRGDRIVVLGTQESERFPTHEEVRAEYADISQLARAAKVG